MLKWISSAVIVCACSVSFGQSYIEARGTNSGLYSDVNFTGDSSAKSTVPELSSGRPGSRYKTNTTLNGTATWNLAGLPGFVAGANYEIAVTCPTASLDAASTAYVVYDTAHPEGTPIQSGTAVLTGANAGDKWYVVAANVTLGAGAAIKFTTTAPQGNRLYSDGLRLTQLAGINDWSVY